MCKKKILLLVSLAVIIPLFLIGGLSVMLFPSAINMVFGTHFNHSLNEDIRVSRETLKLAEFPKSATDFHRQDWSNLFSGNVYMSFSAAAEEIDVFLNESEGLEGVQPQPLTDDHMIYLDFEGLSWFRPFPSESVIYEISGEDSFGYVVYDRQADIVYIMVSW